MFLSQHPEHEVLHLVLERIAYSVKVWNFLRQLYIVRREKWKEIRQLESSGSVWLQSAQNLNKLPACRPTSNLGFPGT